MLLVSQLHPFFAIPILMSPLVPLTILDWFIGLIFGGRVASISLLLVEILLSPYFFVFIGYSLNKKKNKRSAPVEGLSAADRYAMREKEKSENVTK